MKVFFSPRDSFHAHQPLSLSIGSRCTLSTAPQAPASKRPSRSLPPGSCQTRRSRRPRPTLPPTPLPTPPAGPSNLKTHTRTRALTHAETRHASRQKGWRCTTLGFVSRRALFIRSVCERRSKPEWRRCFALTSDKKKKKKSGPENLTK